ncbi:MAG: M23 family metallopeptidase [Pseudomonadota bacterium]|nr:M23 family metallopeptidase [Pseudomonadota bacterium]
MQPNDGEGCSEVCAGPGHGCSDHGLGNTVIVEHILEDGSTTHTQYSHLDRIDVALGDCLEEGDVIGVMGGSAYGCTDYWPKHLHFERKDAPVLENPSGAGTHYGYTPDYGFIDPLAPIPAVGQCR